MKPNGVCLVCARRVGDLLLEIRTRTSGTYERCHPQGAGTWRRGGLIQAIGVSLQVRRNSTVPPLPRY